MSNNPDIALLYRKADSYMDHELNDAVARIEDTIQRLREALEEYGQHADDCLSRIRHQTRPSLKNCTCGLDDILMQKDKP